MLWIYLALIAYFIDASAYIIDKHLLGAKILKPYSYAIGVSFLSLGVFVLIPFGVHWYGWTYLCISLLSGALFFIALINLYKAIIMSDISVVSTQVGTVGAIFTQIFSLIILRESLSFSSNLAIAFLIFGIVLLGWSEKHILKYAVIAGVLSALYFVLLKLSFNLSNLVNGIFWTRLGFIGAAVVAMLVPSFRKEAFSNLKSAPASSKFLFVLNKIISGTGFVILYISIQLGNVSIVNSMLGFQFLFTFILAVTLRNKIRGLEYHLDRKVLIRKISGIAAVLVGFIILFR